jgi:hypothetical protein
MENSFLCFVRSKKDCVLLIDNQFTSVYSEIHYDVIKDSFSKRFGVVDFDSTDLELEIEE